MCCILLLVTLAGCVNNNDTNSINVVMLDGAPLLPMAKMRSDNSIIDSNYSINYTTILDTDALSAALFNKTADFAVVPVNVASIMYNNGSGYKCAAVTIWGIMHIVSSENISTLSHLKGSTVVAFGRSGTPGITLRSVLKQAGINFVEDKGASFDVPSDTVHIMYLASASDVRNVLINGKIDGLEVKHGLLAEPVATAIAGASGGKITAKINIQDEWAALNGGQSYPQAVLVFQERLLVKDKAFVDKFILAVQASSEYAQNNAMQAGELAVSLGSLSIPNGNVVQNAVSNGRLDLSFMLSNQAKEQILAYFGVIYNDTPSLIGNKLPDDGFFY